MSWAGCNTVQREDNGMMSLMEESKRSEPGFNSDPTRIQPGSNCNGKTTDLNGSATNGERKATAGIGSAGRAEATGAECQESLVITGKWRG